jgi:hypothetical protein
MTDKTETASNDPVHGYGWNTAARWGGWTWQTREPEHFRRCSFCGSVHPADLAAEPAWTPQWADRKYNYPHKFYVDIPNRDPDALFCIGSSSRPDEPGWVPTDHLTDEQRAIVTRDGMGREGDLYGAYWFGTRANHNGKFYTAHLADPAVPDDVREAIFRSCGLRFSFVDGRVAWAPASPAQPTS